MGKNSPSYKLFYTLVVLFLLFVGCFILYQHHRERAFRIELLQTQLQDFNHQVYDMLQDDSIVYPNKQQQVLLRRLIGQQNKEWPALDFNPFQRESGFRFIRRQYVYFR